MSKWFLLFSLLLPPSCFGWQEGGTVPHSHNSTGSGGSLSNLSIGGTLSASSFTVTSSATINGGFTTNAGTARITGSSGLTVISSVAVGGSLTVLSSGTFGTSIGNLYNITTTSGISVNNGELRFAGGPDSGIRYQDGSVSTSAALSAAAGYTAKFSTADFNPATTFTNIAFDTCLPGGSTATLTGTNGNQGVKVTFGFLAKNAALDGFVGLTVLKDGSTFPSGGNSTTPIASSGHSEVAARYHNITGTAYFPAQTVASHTYCLAALVNTNTGTTQCGTSDATQQLCYIIAEEIP